MMEYLWNVLQIWILSKLKSIYNQIKIEKKLTLYLEGINHFNQSVIFLDFENKSLTPKDVNIDYQKSNEDKKGDKTSKRR